MYSIYYTDISEIEWKTTCFTKLRNHVTFHSKFHLFFSFSKNQKLKRILNRNMNRCCQHKEISLFAKKYHSLVSFLCCFLLSIVMSSKYN